MIPTIHGPSGFHATLQTIVDRVAMLAGIAALCVTTWRIADRACVAAVEIAETEAAASETVDYQWSGDPGAALAEFRAVQSSHGK